MAELRATEDERVTDLEEAAKNYVAARIANEAAEPSGWSESLALVDMYWHDLLLASGLMDEIEP